MPCYRLARILTCSAVSCVIGGCSSSTANGVGAGSNAGNSTGAAGISSGSSNSAGNAATGGTSNAGTSGAGSAIAGTAGSSTAAGSAGATSGLDCTGRLICDDFEKASSAGSQPGAPWKLRQDEGRVTYDDTRAVSGKYSVKVSINATTPSNTYRRAFINIDGAPLLPSASNKIFGRFMVYTDRIPNQSVHWTFAHGDGPYAATGTTATYNYGGMGNLMANYYRTTQPNATDCWQTKDESFPTGKWQCVAFSFDGPNNEMRFWLGKSEVNELRVLGNQKSDQTCTVKGVDGKWYAPTFKNISIGWESYQHDNAGAHDAWIDDVVLDDEPVACP